jgi:hypothetical protein
LDLGIYCLLMDPDSDPFKKAFSMNTNHKNAAGDKLQSGLVLTVTAAGLPKLVGLLNAGFMINLQVGESVKTLLCGRLGLDQAYFDERIQTLFLNNKPVDDPVTAVVKDGSILALSAAMPGLVGATFRKGGRYSWMRSSISHPDDNDVTAGKTGWVTVKLFNMILKELGPFFLEAGVWLKGEAIQAFFVDRFRSLVGDIQSVNLNGRELAPEALLEFKGEEESVYIKVVPHTVKSDVL